MARPARTSISLTSTRGAKSFCRALAGSAWIPRPASLPAKATSPWPARPSHRARRRSPARWTTVKRNSLMKYGSRASSNRRASPGRTRMNSGTTSKRSATGSTRISACTTCASPWARSCYWRKDGQVIWHDDSLFAQEGVNYGHTEKQAAWFIHQLAHVLDVKAKHILPAYEDAWYNMWRERQVPTNVDPLESRLEDKEERVRLARIFNQGLKKIAGYVL